MVPWMEITKNEKAELTETFDFLYYEVIFKVMLLY